MFPVSSVVSQGRLAIIRSILLNKCFKPSVTYSAALPIDKARYTSLISCYVARNYSTEGCRCWNCGFLSSSASPIVNFCPNCNTIQPLKKELSYFQIFGLSNTFDINKKDISSIYRRLQGFFHPDKFSNSTQEEQEIAASNSALVNKAYHTLLHPVERALYFLILYDRPLEESEITLEADFLSEIMEINEKLQEANSKETIIGISQINNSMMNELLRETSQAFLREDIDAARILVAKIKYYNNIYEKIKQLELKFGIMH